MIALRHKQLWLSRLVGLALVITGVLSPAQAFACAELSGGSQPKACTEMAQAMSCCCPAGEQLTQTHHAVHGAGLTASGCGCTVQAPDAPAVPASKASVPVFSPDLALVVTATPTVELPRSAPWTFGAPATGPPLGPVRATGPARAPPAL